jgi:hypothetical protein
VKKMEQDYPFDQKSFNELIEILRRPHFARANGTAQIRWAMGIKEKEKNSSPVRGGVLSGFGDPNPGAFEAIKNFVSQNRLLLLSILGVVGLFYLRSRYLEG